MKKTGIIGLLLIVMLAIVLNCAAMEEPDHQIIVIGQNGVYDLNSAMLALRQDAGHAVIYLNGPLSLNQQVEIPVGLSGLKSVTLASMRGEPV